MLFELYLIDLTPEKREEFLEAHGCWDADVEDPSTFPNNWDIVPIMTFDPDEYDSDDIDEFYFIVSVLDEQNNPSDNLDAFVLMEDAIDYAKNNPGTGVFHEVYYRDKEICEYELVWHPGDSYWIEWEDEERADLIYEYETKIAKAKRNNDTETQYYYQDKLDELLREDDLTGSVIKKEEL